MKIETFEFHMKLTPENDHDRELLSEKYPHVWPKNGAESVCVVTMYHLQRIEERNRKVNYV